MANRGTIYVDSTGEPLKIMGIDYADVLRIIASINRQMSPLSLGSHLSSSSPLSPQCNIDWSTVARDVALSSTECAALWSMLVQKERERFDEDMLETETIVNLFEGTSSRVTPDEHAIHSVFDAYILKNELILSNDCSTKSSKLHPVIQPKKSVPNKPVLQRTGSLHHTGEEEEFKKIRFTESQDKLLLYALRFHGPDYDLIQRLYFPQAPVSYLKARYTGTLKRHAAINLGFTKTSEVKVEKKGTRAEKFEAEMELMFPWVKIDDMAREALETAARDIQNRQAL